MKFRFFLSLMGMLLSGGARFSRALQQQVWLPRVIEIGSDDGIVYHYTFHNRRMSYSRGPAASPTCAITFATADDGFRVLTAADRFTLMMEGMHDGTIRVGGDIAQFLWFEALLRAAAPVRRTAARIVLPSRYLAPSDTDAVAQYITREPVATELDPRWTAAATQRAKLVIMRVPAGERLASPK